jgi:hypothetical protein
MDVVEDPFVTRQGVLNVLSFGNPATEAPLRTLRRHAALSDGIPVPLRSASGHLLGRVHLYNALSADAARLFRWQRHDAAVRLAKKAAKLERSPAGRRVVRAIEDAASHLPVEGSTVRRGTDPRLQAFQAYIDTRRRASWEALDIQALWRSWVSEPRTWLMEEADGGLRDAVRELAARVADVRWGEPVLTELRVSTLIGVIERLDPIAAELRSPGGSRFIVPRRPLDREGLAIVGQAVSVLLEELPGGRVLDFYAAAARLDVDTSSGTDFDPFHPETTVILEPADGAWLERVLASEPTTVPVAPLATGKD